MASVHPHENAGCPCSAVKKRRFRKDCYLRQQSDAQKMDNTVTSIEKLEVKTDRELLFGAGEDGCGFCKIVCGLHDYCKIKEILKEEGKENGCEAAYVCSLKLSRALSSIGSRDVSG
uniref:Uncharacterized protein n=1 Tax=Romanomermis culicivorax TaxID=13658 RepID=A0A915JK36_ROMCU